MSDELPSRVRVRLLVAYDGAPFRGFALNDPMPTVARRLIDAIETMTQHQVSITCAGRTDAGVHAWGQVVTFDADPKRVDPEKMQKSLTKMCRPDIVVRNVEIVDSSFDARSGATERSYRYRVLNRRVPDPFLYTKTWHVARPLDLDAMNQTVPMFLGLHDFTSFCRKQLVTSPEGKEVVAPRFRRVIAADWTTEPDDVVVFTVVASSFCHQMIRGLVGTMVEIGLGERDAGEMTTILVAKDRNSAGTVAPPHGLTLWEVRY